jgi:thymidylate kinase
VAEVVDPALGIGPKAWVQPAGVIMDRYAYSTAVYQGIQAAEQTARCSECGAAEWGGYDREDWARSLIIGMMDDPGWREPDLAVLLDVDSEEAARRRAARSGDVEVFDGLGFQENVVQTYRELWTWLGEIIEPHHYVVVDGNQPKDVVTNEIMKAVWPLFHGCVARTDQVS